MLDRGPATAFAPLGYTRLHFMPDVLKAVVVVKYLFGTVLVARPPSSTLRRIRCGYQEGVRSDDQVRSAATDTRHTKQARNAPVLRQRKYHNEVIDIMPHVKVGNPLPPSTIRIHFYPDYEARQIVIGRCGCHLRRVKSRRST